MIAVYLRVSTDDQSPESQRAEINAWLERNHIPDDQVRWYEDHFTGKTITRPEFQKLMSAIAKGKVDTLVCWKLDRISRSLLDGVKLIGDLAQRGVRVVSITQHIDFGGLTGQLIASLLFGLAEMELAHLKERQAAGIKVAKANGKYKGRKPGSKKGNPDRARALRAKGLTDREIATALNISIPTVYRYLKQA